LPITTCPTTYDFMHPEVAAIPAARPRRRPQTLPSRRHGHRWAWRCILPMAPAISSPGVNAVSSCAAEQADRQMRTLCRRLCRLGQQPRPTPRVPRLAASPSKSAFRRDYCRRQMLQSIRTRQRMSTIRTTVCSIFGTPEVIGWLEEIVRAKMGPHKSAFGIVPNRAGTASSA
jgi:hypothetical protein